jgi:hypothetical protein
MQADTAALLGSANVGKRDSGREAISAANGRRSSGREGILRRKLIASMRELSLIESLHAGSAVIMMLTGHADLSNAV